MKALILVGGYGTRLRPLTFSCAKPLVPFANKPIVVHQIEALVKVGVTEIILAVNHEPEQMREFLHQAEAKYGIKISFSKEDEPLGTAGPLALAKRNGLMNPRDSAPFFMFNSDVICTFPLAEMLDFHKRHGKEGTIFVSPRLLLLLSRNLCGNAVRQHSGHPCGGSQQVRSRRVQTEWRNRTVP